MTWARPLAGLALSVTFALAAGEAGLRWLDGFAVLTTRLTPGAPVTASAGPPGAEAQRWREAVPSTAGLEPAWYTSDPPAVPRGPDEPGIRERLAMNPADPIGALLVWNPRYLQRELCAGHTAGSLGILSEFLVFDPVEPGPYPIFRHLPNAHPPGWFRSNAFGWRGPAITLEKPAGTIRIAFVGASTTIADYGAPFSHPELIGHWLDLWARERQLPYRFEVINAGRTGIDSASIEAIVRQEVAPADPDLVVYYEGANQFAPGALLQLPPNVAAAPTMTFRKRSPLEDYSVTVRRVLTAWDMFNGGNGYEPRKPGYPVAWPRDVDEQRPDISHTPLPMALDAVVANFDRMRASLAPTGAELALSSFVWMVYPGMRLDLARDLTLYRYLNDTYWPITYAHMRRAADFQNRVFAVYAERHGLPFFDIAGVFPKAPELFGDAIHMRPEGLRLKAWIYMQQLIPLITARLDSGRWPRRRNRAPDRDPAAYAPRAISRRDILSSCPS